MKPVLGCFASGVIKICRNCISGSGKKLILCQLLHHAAEISCSYVSVILKGNVAGIYNGMGVSAVDGGESAS